MAKYTKKEIKQIRSLMKLSAVLAVLTLLIWIGLVLNHFIWFYHLHIKISIFVGLILLTIGSITLFIFNYITIRSIK